MRRRFLAAPAAFMWLCAVSCNPSSGGGGPPPAQEACSWQSSSTSGGLCTASYTCRDGTLRSVACAGDSCTCTASDVPGPRFTSAGYCSLSREAQYPIFAANCLPPPATPDGGSPSDAGRTPDGGGACVAGAMVDLLFVVDNSNSMAENQANLGRAFGPFLSALTSPASGPGARSLHVGVVSSDLGTPGTVVPSCAASDGDDGLLNPVRNGAALRMHRPWTTAPPGRRPSRCTSNPDQYPSFLSFDAGGDANSFRDDFICNAYLSIGGCGLEQQLESAYRALVVHNPRETASNTDPNAGFVRDGAVLGIMMFTDEEDGSVRDCRYMESGGACAEATSVFDIMSPQWASNDLNLRLYMYTPGSAQDPTWPLDRYVDPARPARGFPSLKPGRPDLVVFGAITGVPLTLPMDGQRVAWSRLLGSMPDGSDGYTGTSAEGPVSMRQRNMDPMCSTRVVPACRREGTTAATTCDAAAQYFAWPSRRVAQVARRFDEAWGNGTLASICANDHGAALAEFAGRIQRHLCP